MAATLSPQSSTARRSARRVTDSPAPVDRVRRRRGPDLRRRRGVLARYSDAQGRPREVLAQAGLAGSVLVVDRESGTREDARLVAHLGCDEPPENATLICALYLEHVRIGRCRCRLVTGEDFRSAPLADHPDPQPTLHEVSAAIERSDCSGSRYRLELLDVGMSIPQLRWCRCSSTDCSSRPVSVREVVADLESYDPVCTLTRSALAFHGAGGEVSVTVLRAELRRVQESPIVLNGRLRGVVLATIEQQGLSMSEIATRCGRVKVDRKGHPSGETSWLARRLGILPEAGQSTPTPWVHSDVLALIARRGLGISPREVEG